MDSESRRILESPIYQGEDEQLAYALTTTPWGSSPSTPVVTIKNAAGEDKTVDFTTGSASISGDVLTTPTILDLIAGAQYRLEIKFTVNGNVEEAWGDLRGEA